MGFQYFHNKWRMRSKNNKTPSTSTPNSPRPAGFDTKSQKSRDEAGGKLFLNACNGILTAERFKFR